MKIFSYMIVKDEIDRYLAHCLEDLSQHVDGIFVYDDMSEEMPVLKDMNVSCRIALMRRGHKEASFAENESRFRQAAWERMSSWFHPSQDDWILTLDADEFLRAPNLRAVCENTPPEIQGLWTRIHEVWGKDGNGPLIRTDRYWGTINGLRLCRWQPAGTFKDTKQGGGSLPSYVAITASTDEVDILHYGYFKEADRQAKYKRYTETPGHSNAHIQSIKKPPTLAPVPPLGLQFGP